jgi:hypothetical protein
MRKDHPNSSTDDPHASGYGEHDPTAQSHPSPGLKDDAATFLFASHLYLGREKRHGVHVCDRDDEHEHHLHSSLRNSDDVIFLSALALLPVRGTWRGVNVRHSRGCDVGS